MPQDTSSPAYLWAKRRRNAGELEYRSWLVTAQELRDQYEYEAKWDAYLNGESDIHGNPIE